MRAALLTDPAVDSVTIAGSRARGTGTALSDWDFAVATADFSAAAAALPRLVAPLEPISRQWDRLSPFPTYMLMLAGPLKVDLLFPGRCNPPAPPWEPSSTTLGAIDDHFWDWILWLASKRLAQRPRLVEAELRKLHRHLLGPMGVATPPPSPEAAVIAYLEARTRLERRFTVAVPRRLELAVRPTVERALG